MGVSPSARRAWIEIEHIAWKRLQPQVALREEGVDRNNMEIILNAFSHNKSPSARRAWIEIGHPTT